MARNKTRKRRRKSPNALDGNRENTANRSTRTTSVQQALQMAVEHQQAGRLDLAAQVYGEIIAAYPDNPDAHNLLGVIEHQRGNHETAIQLIGRAVAIKPDFAQAHSNLGVALQEQGRLPEAVVSHRTALSITPDSAEANHNLAITLQKMEEREEAVASFRKALAIRPDYAEAQRGLGNTLRSGGRLEEAAIVFQELVASKKAEAEDHNILGIILKELCRTEEAIKCYRQALAMNPNSIEAEHNLGHALLLVGRYEEGWERYEKRFQSKGYTSPIRKFSEPLWTGGPLNGQTIFLYTEQGFGDSIQFIRYTKIVSEKYGGKVIVECQPNLKSLFSVVPGIDILLAAGEEVPEFDVRAPLMSLPHIIGTTLQTIPAEIPYITSKNLPKPIEIGSESRFKVGFLWAGSTMNEKGKIRTVEVSLFEGLVRTQETKFYSLQFGDPSKELKATRFCNEVTDLGPYLEGFAETASVVQQLDLVITIDTYLAHLAGAMGKPAWVLLPYSPDWRWLLEHSDSPWYSSIRLFRQPGPGDWETVFSEVEKCLIRAVKNGEGL
jgi:Flp pilus assembly protein TadD